MSNINGSSWGTDESDRRKSEDRREESGTDHAVRLALLEQSMKSVRGELHAINNNISRLVWVGILAIGTSAMQFVLRGGLS